jgi:hypothetical protein
MSASRLTLIFSLLLFSFAAPVSAGDKIWSAVLLATNVKSPKEPPDELKPVAARLQRIFGYNQFEIVGRDTAKLDDDAKLSLTPTKTFWLNLQARRASSPDARGGYLLNLLLYQNDRPLVDTVAVIAPASPLFFRGPMSSKGQVIVVLQVMP